MTTAVLLVVAHHWRALTIETRWRVLTNEGLETTARASENPLALFAKAERSRRRWRRRRSSTAHLRYGQLDPAVEQSLEIERPPLSDLDEAEIERLLAKYADIARGKW